MGTDAGQHACQKVKLVWHKGVNFCKVFCIGVQFFLYTVVEDNQIFDNGCFLVIEQTQALRCCLCLIQNTLFDNGIHIGRGQGKACIKTSLNLREVISLYLSDRVDILLARHDHPCFAHAFLAQLFCHRLEVQHQLGIIADVLSNLIHKENHMMIAAFFLNIGLYALCEIFNADLIALGCFFTPVAGRRFAHEIHVRKNIHNRILNEIKILTGAFPRIAVLFFKLFLELFKAAFFGKSAFQISKMRHGTTEALHLIEHLQKHINDGIFVFFSVGITF